MPGWEEGDWRDEKLFPGFKEQNLLNSMGLEFYDLSHPWGLGQPCWPYLSCTTADGLKRLALLAFALF